MPAATDIVRSSGLDPRRFPHLCRRRQTSIHRSRIAEQAWFSFRNVAVARSLPPRFAGSSPTRASIEWTSHTGLSSAVVYRGAASFCGLGPRGFSRILNAESSSINSGQNQSSQYRPDLP